MLLEDKNIINILKEINYEKGSCKITKNQYKLKLLNLINKYHINPNMEDLVTYKIGQRTFSLWFYLFEVKAYSEILDLIKSYKMEDIIIIQRCISNINLNDEKIEIFSKSISNFEMDKLRFPSSDVINPIFGSSFLLEIIKLSIYKEDLNMYIKFIFILINNNRYSLNDDILNEIIYNIEQDYSYDSEFYNYLKFYFLLCPDLSNIKNHDFKKIEKFISYRSMKDSMIDGIKLFEESTLLKNKEIIIEMKKNYDNFKLNDNCK